MNLNTLLKLGQSTSLLSGYKPDIYSVPFTNSRKPALYEKEVLVKNPSHDAQWSWPTISLHDNAEDLLSKLLKVTLRPITNEDKASEGGASSIWPAGALVLAGSDAAAHKEATTELSSQLGIDLSKDWSYALVSRTRTIGRATHPCYERGLFGLPDPATILKPDFVADLKSLEKLGKDTNVSMHGANGYLDVYETYGSHFVSSVDIGDTIFQVFAYASTDYQGIVRVYADNPEDLTGPASSTFALFTTPRNEAGYGRTAAIGNVCIASRDPEMAESIKEGLWEEPKYAGTNSIFAPFLRSDAVDVNKIFKKIVPISVELASLGVFAEYYRMLIWRRVFKGAMYAKYSLGSGVAPFFSNNCPYDLNSVFKDSGPLGGDGFLSTIATPSVNIWQEKVKLNSILLQFPELVKIFGVFANAIEIPAPSSKDNVTIDVPGSTDATLLGHVVTCGSGQDPVPPTLRLSDCAFKDIKTRFFCGEFYGGLNVISSSDKKGNVIMNGLMFEESMGKVSVVLDVRHSPTLEVLTERLTDIQFALVAAEARLNFLLVNPVSQVQNVEIMKRFLLWLGGVAGSHYQYQNDQLAALQARAMYLASVATNDQGSGVPVPYLRYEAYKDVVNNVQNVLQTASDKLNNFQNQIRDRKAEEREVDREKNLNENIIKSGKLLQDYIGTQASYQQSLEDMFSTVVKDKESQLDKASKQAEKLSASLTEQRSVVKEAITEYEDAVAEWQKQETIKAAIGIASNIFALGFTFITPASSITALKTLGETVQKIQKAVTVFNAVIKAYRSIQALPSNPQAVVDALKSVGPNGLVMPSSLEWDEMKVNFDAVLSSGPAVGAKTSLSAAFAVLVLRGKALIQSQQSIQEIAADLSAGQQRITLHKDQKKRLDDLKINLDAKPQALAVDKIDLIGLSGQLIFFERQMLMILASTLVIQDRALQYEYLRPPTTIGSFTMLNLQLAILYQSQSINQGLTVQPFPAKVPKPIIYEIHGVKPESIIDNNSYTFVISLNKREFSSYNYVRVEGVEVEIGGIVSTNSGKYYTELVFDGNPFFDRGFDGEALTFQTTSRIFTGLHDVSTSSHVGSDAPVVVENSKASVVTTGEDPFGGKISSITPFSSWQVALPKTKTNEDIRFDDHSRGVTVRLIFYIYAQLKEESLHSSSLQALHLNRGDYVMSHTSSGSSIQAHSSQILVGSVAAPLSLVASPSLISSASASATSSVALDEVLNMMSGKSVCAGWDVVFSMTAKEVNDQLYMQYTNRLGNPKFIRETGNVVKESKTSEGATIKTVFNFVFNAPRLQFLLNNSHSAQIFLPIISGHYEYSIYANGAWIPISKADVKETDKSYIQGDVPLDILPGSVSSQHNVAIKLNGGAFSAKNFEAGVSNPILGSVLTDYFTNLKDGYEVYNLGTLDFAAISLLQSLIPTDFMFNVYHTPSNRDLLQLFVATTGKLQSSTSLYLQEPIPSVYQSSLIVNTKIFFQDILPASLGDGGIHLAFDPVAPADDGNKDKVWSLKTTAGSVLAPYPETKVSSSSQGYRGSTTYSESWVRVDNNTAVVDLSGMEFQSGDQASGWDAKMKYEVGTRNYPFQYGTRSRMCSIIGCASWSGIHYHNYSLGVDVNMNANLPLNVTGSGQNQLVEIAATQSNVDLDGKLEPPAGACQCNDREMQKKFLENLNKSVPGKLVDVFNKPFGAVSLFALKNLLFPAKNLINMRESYVPGDMVVFGNFTSGSE